MSRAFVFPGQGSQYPGMGRALFEAFPEARRLFEEADEALDFPISRLCFEGPEQELLLTENTQPAILTASIAAFRVIEAIGLLPEIVAGHSLGEYSALVAAGSLSFEDAVRLVRLRGRFMQEAVPVGTGAMAAILGLDRENVESACREAAEGVEVLSPANFNAPSQVVVAGHATAVERVAKSATARGAKRVIPLPVSAPFHCALMKPAEVRLADEIGKVSFADLRFPLVNNVDARVITSAGEARQGLVRQVCAPVRWTDSVLKMSEAGVTSFVEVGPGKVLSGLIRKTVPGTEVTNIDSREQLEAYVRT